MSLPMRERGLKRGLCFLQRPHPPVAPHAGAWIETIYHGKFAYLNKVAPHAGAWIETVNSLTGLISIGVAPHAGAWIETGKPSV